MRAVAEAARADEGDDADEGGAAAALDAENGTPNRTGLVKGNKHAPRMLVLICILIIRPRPGGRGRTRRASSFLKLSLPS